MGCATTPTQPTQFIGPHGNTAYAIECSQLPNCYAKLNNVCEGKTYTIIDTVTESVIFPRGYETAYIPYYTLIIECDD